MILTGETIENKTLTSFFDEYSNENDMLSAITDYLHYVVDGKISCDRTNMIELFNWSNEVIKKKTGVNLFLQSLTTELPKHNKKTGEITLPLRPDKLN